MSTLRDLQEKMQAYIIEDDQSIVDAIVDPKGMEVLARLDVYQKGYYLRLIEILETDFTALRQVMGQDAFSTMVRQYLRAYPSHYFSIRSVGCNVPRFLEHANYHPGDAELASFELFFNTALVAEDADTLALQDLVAYPPEKWPALRLTLHPSVQTFSCCYNTMLRWSSLDSGSGDIDSIHYDNPLHHVIWRKEGRVYFAEISEQQHALMRGIQRGEDFATLCENSLEYWSEDTVVESVTGTLREWVIEGLFSKIV